MLLKELFEFIYRVSTSFPFTNGPAFLVTFKVLESLERVFKCTPLSC